VQSHEGNANQSLENDPYEAIEFIDTAGCDYAEELLEQGSIINRGEADLLEKILITYSDKNIGIISPYRGQVYHLQTLLKGISNKNINTIYSFQGQERAVIIVSMVRSNNEQIIGFLKDYRRMNVAMTRAQKKLVLIGDSATLGSDKFYLNLLDFLEKKGSYRSAWEFMD
jgi:superfamily I DNA and/or RNA helicase